MNFINNLMVIKKLKKFICILVLLLTCISCYVPGSKELISSKEDSIEVYRYYISKDDFIYISRFKSCPNVITVTWDEFQGKTTRKRSNVVIYENDSIITYKKEK